MTILVFGASGATGRLLVEQLLNRRLVTDATRRLCNADKANKSDKSTRYVLMNTVGNSNRDLQKPISFGQRIVVGLIRLLLPPHVDNEKAADYLRIYIDQNGRAIEWTAVRLCNMIKPKICLEI